MAQVSAHDLELWKFIGSSSGEDLQDNAVATATLADPGDGFRLHAVKVDASYETSTTSGLLTVFSGATIIARKYIHGAGAIDFSDNGRMADNASEAMSAQLAASGTAGTDGTVTMSGFYRPDPTV